MANMETGLMQDREIEAILATEQETMDELYGRLGRRMDEHGFDMTDEPEFGSGLALAGQRVA